MPRGWICAGLLALGLAAASAGAQDGETKKLQPLPMWAESIETALADGKKRNVAVLVALNIDNERGNDNMVRSVYRSKVFTDAAKKCVVAIASLYEHDETKHPVTGEPVCSRFGTISCAEHKALEKIIRVDWLKAEGQMIDSPKHFFLAPDGRILFRRTWTMSANQLAGLMKLANKYCDAETLAKWDTLEGRLSRAVDPLQAMREIALKDLLDENDPKIDARLAEAARKTKDLDTRMDIVGALAVSEDATRRGIAYGFLTDKDAKTRVRTAYLLEKRKDANAVPTLLTRAGKEKDAKVRAGLYRALGACGGGDKKVRDALLKFARKKKDEAAPHAIIGLAGWGEDAAVFKALQKVPWTDTSPIKVRKAATWWLGLTGKTDLRKKLRALAKDERSLEKACGNAVKRLAGRYDQVRYLDSINWEIGHPAW